MANAILMALPGLCALLFFLPRPLTALRNYLLLLPFLPEFLVVDVGVKLTGSRIASIVLLLALLYRATGKLTPRFDRMDLAFGAFLAIYITAVIGDGAVFVAGFLMDVALPYYFVRCLVRSTADIQFLVRSLLMPTTLVLLLAAVQSFTGRGLFDAFKVGDAVFGNYDSGMKRLGLTRADVGLTHYIMMGLWFASLVPIAIGHYRGLGMDFGRVVARVILLPFGAFFSLSGGSFLVTGVGVGTFSLWPLRRILVLLIAVAAMTVTYIECFSNRGTLAILATFAATDGDSAWYRIRLPSAVFAVMDGHWWSGFGLEKPAMGIYNDITNHYLWWLMQGGLPCMLAFIALYAVSFQRLYRASQAAVTPYMRMFSWGLGVAIFALGLGLMSVSLFGQMRTYLFLFFAIAPCCFAAARQEVRVVAEWIAETPMAEPEPAASSMPLGWLDEIVLEDEVESEPDDLVTVSPLGWLDDMVLEEESDAT